VRRRDRQDGDGWYWAVAGPAFFALPPEASHRLATAFLGLPLPWERLGGAVEHAPVDLCGIGLPNPIGLAAGFDKTCRHLDALGRVGFGFVVGGTITRAPRAGNSKPRIVRQTDRRAIVNSMGLPNPGADAAAANLASRPRTAPRLVSVADEAIDDAIRSIELLAPLVDGIELNASSPNAPWRHDRAHLGALLGAFRARALLATAFGVALITSDEERTTVTTLAREAIDAGASGLVCANTIPVEEPKLAAGRGGLSGGPLTDLTPRIVEHMTSATGAAVPIVASGGIFTPHDLRRCLDAGATAVQLYTGLIYRGPGIVGDLTRALARTGEDEAG